MANKRSQAWLTDEQIIDLYFAREERAIAETDKKYSQYLHTVAYSILANEQDAEECLQDTYLRVWHAIPPERPSIFHAFLAKITRNLSLNRLKTAKRQKRVPSEASVSLQELEECVSDGDSLSRQLQSAAVARAVNRYLDGVSDRRMYVFISRYFYALTIPQIAKRLSCSVSLVNRELTEIRRELRIELEKEGIEA